MISSFSDGADGSPRALPGARPPSPLPKRTWSELPGHGPHPGGRAVQAERARRTGWAWPSAAGTAGPWAVGLRGRPSGVGLLSAGPQGRAVSCSPVHRPPLHFSFPFCEARPCPAQTSASPSLVGSHSQGTASGSGPGTWCQGREAALAGPAGCGPLSPPFWIAQS